MQRDKTIRFWDDFHVENDSEEWISDPGEELLQMISDQLTVRTNNATPTEEETDHNNNNNNNNSNDNENNNDKSRSRRPKASILEIGCGTSTLLRDLKRHIEEKDPGTTVLACGSDVSRVCVDANRKRDCPCADGSSNSTSTSNANANDDDNDDDGNEPTLWYEVLNVLEGEPSRRNWDLIVDKGCLDTFLFRSRQRGAQNKAYPESLRIVLDNIHGWLATGNGGGSVQDGNSSNGNSSGRYIFLSPRSKVKGVRDFAGFASVRKHSLPGIYSSRLQGKKGNDHTPNGDAGETPGDDGAASPGYMFVCTKNDAYEPGISPAFSSNHRGGVNNSGSSNGNDNAAAPADDSRCPRCPLTFRDFRKAEQMQHRGVAYWTRRWRAHGLHCKGNGERARAHAHAVDAAT